MLVLFYITFITNGMTYNFLLVVVAAVVLSPVFTALFISSSELAPLGDLLLPLLLYVTQSHNTLYYHNYHVIPLSVSCELTCRPYRLSVGQDQSVNQTVLSDKSGNVWRAECTLHHHHIPPMASDPAWDEAEKTKF